MNRRSIGRRITPSRLVAAWVAEQDGSIAGHVALVRGMRFDAHHLQLRGTAPTPAKAGPALSSY